MFGRLVPRKGYSEFVQAARTLRERHGEKVEFWILGIEDKESEASLNLARKVREAHEDGAVRFFPPVDDVLPYVRAADVVVLPF